MPTDVISGKTIAIGVTGSIAAYKAVEIVRRLIERGAQVHVLMTDSASRFVAPLTFQTLSRNRVLTDLFEPTGDWEIEHVAMADKIALLLVAPATANVIARLAAGIADDPLTCLALSTRAPVVIAPAMDSQMLLHPATQENIERLGRMGYRIIEPARGALASGKTGPGRLPEPHEIVDRIESELSERATLAGRKIVVTAGPTWEPIDPVRHISNPSSGKMGYAIAAEAARRGAQVVLVSGPTALAAPAGVQSAPVRTAREMLSACLDHCRGADAFIAAAAVADYSPARPYKEKRKKTLPTMTLALVRTQDIIEHVSRQARPKVVVGFAAETSNLIENARKKLRQKGLDMIVANDVSKPQEGFGSDFASAVLLFKDGTQQRAARTTKSAMARRIVESVARLLA